MSGYYDDPEIRPYHGKGSPARTSMPWWNPRYWAKKVWIAIAAVLIIVIIIAVAVGVTVSKQNAYPSYKELSYKLQDTCGFILSRILQTPN